MLLVIEGGDKTGKTTLAKALAKTYHLDYHHFGPPGPDPMKEYVDFFKGLKSQGVCDRFFIGNLVYGPLLRNTVTPWLEVLTLCRLLRKHGVFHMLASPSIKVVEERFKASKDAEYVTWVQNIKAIELFSKVFASLPVGRHNKRIIFNETNDDLLDVISDMAEVVQRQRVLNTTVPKFTGIGTTTEPALVLVGESVNPRTTRFGLPFDAGISAEFLQMCLHEARVNEEDLYLMNQDVMTTEEVVYHKQLGSYFVALGTKAHERLKALGAEHSKIAHPQFFRRFRSKQWKHYRDSLAVACDKFQVHKRRKVNV